ncbi:MAG: fimbrillin family protein [Bacteroidaceae bacterium]|nr:fimbrillin family protein [Bacteroidaceae bacterium]
MKHWSYIIVLWISALLCGCADHDDTTPLPSSDMAVQFDVNIADNNDSETRAGYYNATIDLNVLKASTAFGVYAYYTGANSWDTYATEVNANAGNIYPNFMYNQQVFWNTDEAIWTYSPLKYWPNGEGTAQDNDGMGETKHKVSFFAYAPYVALNITNTSTENDPTTDTTYGITAINGCTKNGPTIDYAVHPTKPVDLLYANSQTDKVKQDITSKVPFTFRHALACIDIYVTRNVEDSLTADEQTKILINSFTLDGTNIFQTGTLQLKDGTWTPTSVSSTSFTYQGTGSSNAIALSDNMRGAAKEASKDDIKEQELNRFDKVTGVDETERQLSVTNILLIPTESSTTFTPTLTYTFLTRDDELQLNNDLKDDNSHYYSRIQQTITGTGTNVAKLEKGKRYKLLCTIGVEHVTFEVIGVEKWDFPMRYTTTITDYTGETKEKTVNESD